MYLFLYCVLCVYIVTRYMYDAVSRDLNFTREEEEILLTTMLTIKILFTINSLKKKKKLFIQKHYLQFLSN